MKNWIGITWAISNRFGWGVYGLNLVLELLRRGRPTPVCLDEITVDTLPADVVETLQPVIDFRKQNLSAMHRAGKVAKLGDAMVLHCMGNGMEWGLLSQAFEGEANVGMIFFEYTEASAEALARARRLDAIVAGSTWNAEVMRGWGLENVECVFQGVDTSLFRPLPRRGEFDGKFVVFSGGKLDYRKGQDIVLKAFAAFSQRHEDALLVTAWHNLWPLTALAFQHSPHVSALPKVRPDGMLNIAEWAAAHGVAPAQFIDVGMLPNQQMPQLLSEVDLAVFPNRCEGGTNLVAMEAMACGVPCILSDNTGHRDLVGEDRCYALERQDTVSLPATATDGWGESSVEELVERMEHAYQHRRETQRVGQAGADFMRDWAWSNRIGHLLEVLEHYG